MVGPQPSPFGVILREYRLAAGLSQEALAARAGLSPRAISDLERGARRLPYPQTVRLLADALGLAEADQERLRRAVTDRRRPAQNGVMVRVQPLPTGLSVFVGRAYELEHVGGLLAGTRLLTLVGAGGIGKTRLALEVAAHSGRWRDRAWFVDLSALRDATQVMRAVAAAIGIEDEPARPPLAGIAAAIHSGQALIILDNCEHLLPASADVAVQLLAACPALTILATSRQHLGCPDEVVWRVPSLSLPDDDTPAAVETSDAGRLFRERARVAMPDFALSDGSAAAVAMICHRLDGIPLAIELAVARVKILTPEQIAARLDERFRLLTGGSRFAPPRQQTLRATLDWSHDLLTEPERVLLRRLSVFAGSCEIEAVETVCTGGAVAADAIFDLLALLLDKSLLVVEHGGGRSRYRLLETVRQYAAERLADSDERAPTRQRQAAFYVALAERAQPGLFGPEQDTWLARLDADAPNLRAAIEWAEEQDEAEVGLRLGAALWDYWYRRGYAHEGLTRLTAVLAQPGAIDHPAARVRALIGASFLARARGSYATARSFAEESLAVCRDRDDRGGIAQALFSIGFAARLEGDFGVARATLEESLALHRGLGDAFGVATALHQLGLLAIDHDRDYERGQSLLEESLALFRSLGNHRHIALTRVGLGMAAHGQRDVATAHSLITDGLAALAGLNDAVATLWALDSLILLLGESGHSERTVRLAGAAAGLGERHGTVSGSVAEADRDRWLGQARRTLGDEPFQRAWQEGCELTLADLASEVLRPPAEQAWR